MAAPMSLHDKPEMRFDPANLVQLKPQQLILAQEDVLRARWAVQFRKLIATVMVSECSISV